jgi:hypothetical protein
MIGAQIDRRLPKVCNALQIVVHTQAFARRTPTLIIDCLERQHLEFQIVEATLR